MTTGISDMNQKISANEGHIHKNINPYPNVYIQTVVMVSGDV